VGAIVLTTVPAGVSFAQTGEGEVMMPMPGDPGFKMSRAAKLRTALDPDDPDSVWIGHVFDPAWRANTSYPAGGYGPYKVGRGPNRPSILNGPTSNPGYNGVWDFDRWQVSEVKDSLQGWWPLARPFQSAGASDFPDYRRAFFAHDYGNQANYVINQGLKRTFGVVGVWHRDEGDNAVLSGTNVIGGTNPVNVSWDPTELGATDDDGNPNTAVAWMGIRSHGDLTHNDADTGNPFNANLLQYQGNNANNQIGSNSTTGTDHNFPGYGSQMDQMLYRDVMVGEADGLDLSFNFSTNMSIEKLTGSAVRVGWFDKDPVSNARNAITNAPTGDGNFISSTLAGVNAPIDSFMVYIGAPVDDNNVVFTAPLLDVSSNPITTVFDPKRRWFSEVVRCNETGTAGALLYLHVAGFTGANAPQRFATTIPALNAQLQAIKDADGVGGGGKVRIVFRVKTNRGSDDEDSFFSLFNSGTRGAVRLDNVMTNASTGLTSPHAWDSPDGNFEAADAIDNSKDALDAWRSTGKPPPLFFHVRNISEMIYSDPCGVLTSANRSCNLEGKVVSPGNRDFNEKPGGEFGNNYQDQQKWFASPTINFMSTGAGDYNAMGIDREIANATEYDFMFDLYNGGLKGSSVNGNFMSVGYQSYPATQPNGVRTWGETRHGLSIFFYGVATACFQTFFLGAKANQFIRTSNADGIPDSLRIYIQQLSRCFTTSLTAANCSPTTAPFNGIYYDNISFLMVDAAPPAPLSISIWDLTSDAFPSNRNDGLVPAGFDTCAAHVRVGINGSQAGGTGRPSIPNDTTFVTAPGPNVRMDMVFRILPGPGNYVQVGNRASGVAQRADQGQTPDNGAGARTAASAADFTNGALSTSHKFWGAYLSDNGVYGSPGGHPSGSWSEHVWNSARMDSAERNLFPATENNGNLGGIIAGVYASMLHEGDGDPGAGTRDSDKFANLGILKNRCFLVNPAAGQATTSINITCGSGTYPPAWVTAGAGYDGNVQTREYTKIIPDGQLTAGSHVEYFFRKSTIGTSTFVMGPDTTVIFQDSEASSDGHRWQQWSVLPDRWKDGAWASFGYQHANAPACMLFVDYNDRRGDELIWVGVADSIGATASGRRGAHNGWRATGYQDVELNDGSDISLDPTIAVYAHGGQPGTVWDLWNVKAAESQTTGSAGAIGSEFAVKPVTPDLRVGKENKNGPTLKMLTTYYQYLLVDSGDLNTGFLGPYSDKTDNDVKMLTDFATSTPGGPSPRGVWAQGRGFLESQENLSTGHPTFCDNLFTAQFSSGNYRTLTANTNDIIDLAPGPAEWSTTDVYGVNNNCFLDNDVATVLTGGASAARYAQGTAAERIASVYKAGGVNGIAAETLIDGWRITSIGSRYTLGTAGRIDYFAKRITELFGTLNCDLSPGTPVGVGDGPNGGSAFVNFMALRSENPMRSGEARIAFGITKTEKVEVKVYDVTGRLVKTVANRVFAGGEEHVVRWDGTDEAGNLVPRGVYFYQLRSPSFTSQKKLAVLSY
jgi:hypothetical protein